MMYLKELHLFQFKNLNDLFFQSFKGLNFIIANNGAGKTNLLDAIHYCCMTKSYFQITDRNSVQHDQSFFRIESKWQSKKNVESINVKYQNKSVRQVEWNDIEYSKASEHLGKIPVVMIVPNEVYTFVEESEIRRKFLNQTLVQVDAFYLEQLNTYNQLLKQKSAALKSMKSTKYIDTVLLDSYELKMEEVAQNIYLKRKNLIEKIKPNVEKYSALISNQSQYSQIEYESHLEFGNCLDLWKEQRDYDMITGRIHTGIHRDKLKCTFNGTDLRTFGSQGQIKTFVIALRLAQVQYLMEYTKSKPILLLDDLFSKLDENRVELLLSLLEEMGIEQCFITDTHLSRAQKIKQNSTLNSSIFVLEKSKLQQHA